MFCLPSQESTYRSILFNSAGKSGIGIAVLVQPCVTADETADPVSHGIGKADLVVVFVFEFGYCEFGSGIKSRAGPDNSSVP
jgi:hypothetical protein